MSAAAVKYSKALADAIVERVSRGEPLAVICREPGMPHRSSFHDWKDAHPELKAAFEQARDDGYDAIADRLRKTARGRGEDSGGDSTGDVQRDKLIIDTDLKLLAKWDPRRYGDKVQHADADGNKLEQPVTHITINGVAAKAAKDG